MKKLEIAITGDYKLYKKGTHYDLEGDLILLSGINGSGKSQLLRLITKNDQEPISRSVIQTRDSGDCVLLENALLISFRDNIDLGKEFGQFSVTYRKSNATKAWEYYSNNIKHKENLSGLNQMRTQAYKKGTLIFNDKGNKHPAWRSIIKLIELLNKNYDEKKLFTLTQSEVEDILPQGFIWRNENDIISQTGNLFYIACCERVNEQIACSKTTEVFDNEAWLKSAPWTILNELFEDLRFKYRFKRDYAFNTPYMEENPKLRLNAEVRDLGDLSDGEKAILKLALISLDEEISQDISLVLFDEYDAPLNPSLTEAFYHVIEKFYIQKGIQVVITTHSPATISLAPEYAQFYEIFSQENNSPKIVRINQFDYEELRLANKQFYDRIKNQEQRIEELENMSQMAGKMLLVEDQYDQIYKIAFLKLKGIDGLTEENLDQVFSEYANFAIHGNYSTGGLYSKLICSNITAEENCTTVCLFDFDAEGYRKFKDLGEKKTNHGKMFPTKYGTIRDGLCIKHYCTNRYALMIPIPERLEKYVSEKTSSDCFVEIETLLSEEYLSTNPKAELRSVVLPFYKMKDSHKKDFWKDLLTAPKEVFQDFEPLFKQIEWLCSESK